MSYCLSCSWFLRGKYSYKRFLVSHHLELSSCSAQKCKSLEIQVLTCHSLNMPWCKWHGQLHSCLLMTLPYFAAQQLDINPVLASFSPSFHLAAWVNLDLLRSSLVANFSEQTRGNKMGCAGFQESLHTFAEPKITLSTVPWNLGFDVALHR